MSLLDDIANGFRQMFGGGNNNNRRPQDQPKPYTSQYDFSKSFDTNFNPSRDFSNPYQMNNDEEERREQERKRREEEERRRQAEEARHREAERKKQEAERLKQATQKKPGFFDYLNPLGEHGLFGAKQQQNFKNAIKPINDTLQAYEKTIDKSDKQAGFQWNDIGDYLRFAAKLPTGMVSGVANAPEKIGQAISGVRNNDKGEVEHLNLLQRGATALDAGIDIGGLGFGGSGTLLKGVFKKAGQEAAEQAAKTGIKQTIKSIAKDALQEGIEEGTQTFLGDLSDDGKLNADLNRYVQSVALGALGGGVMSGAGKSISSAKQAYLESPKAKLDSQIAQQMATDPKFAEAVAKRKQEIKQVMLEAREEAAKEQAAKKSLSQTVADAYHDGKLPIPRTELTPNAGRNARMRQAIDNAPISEPFNYGRVSKDAITQHNDIQAQTGQDFVKNRDVTVYPNAHNAHVEKRIHQEGISPEDYIKAAENAIYGNDRVLLPSRSNSGQRNVIYENPVNPSRAILGQFNDGLSLKSVQKLSQKTLSPELKNTAEIGDNLVSSDLSLARRQATGLASNDRVEVADRQLAGNFTDATTANSLSQTDEKVNPVEYNDLHEAEYQPSGSVLDRRQRFDATATEVDGQVQASERAWRDNRGTEVGTNDEVAREKIAQLLKDYRNPDRELTHFFYVKDGVIVGHNVTTLNDPISSSVGAKEAMWGINNRMERLGADKFYLAHNHPSGNLSASSGDRHVTQIIQKQLGDKFGGHIITDHDGILTSKDGYFDKTNIDLGEQYVKDGVQITTEDKALELAKEHFDPKVNHDKIGLFILDVLYRPIGYERFRPRMKDGKVDIEATNNTIKQMAAKHNGIVTLVAAGDDFKHIDNRTGIQGIIGDQLMLPTDFGDFRSLNNFEGGDTKSQSARLRKYLARNGKNNFLHDGASDIKQVIDQKQDEFKNVPLENKNHAYTKGNLYQQTAIGSAEDVVRGGGSENGRRFMFGDWEMRQHTRKKNGKSFTQVERRYIDPETGEAGDWKPYSRAAYLWHTQSDKIDQANRDQLIQQALEAAKQDGEVREFVAKIDETTGGTKVEQLTGNKTIDGGLVRDPVSGEVEGNYIQVTPFGIVNQVAGKLHLTELDQIIAKNEVKETTLSQKIRRLIDPDARASITDTFMRGAEKMAANERSKQTQQNLYYKKTKAYAEFIKNKEEVLNAHTEQAGILEGYRPAGVKSKQFWEDVGRYTENTFPAIEGKNQQEAFAKKYGDEAAQAVEKYSQYMRQQYDTLLENANAVRRMYGKDEILHRKDYMPHMLKKSGLIALSPAQMATNIANELEAAGREGLPARIAGLSEGFKPNKKYNPHELSRKADEVGGYELDPRKVFEKYTDLVLYNTHMEPVIAEGRQLEAAMRVADHEDGREVLDPLSALKQGDAKVSSRQTISVMDFVNAMAGKSNALDRAFIDRAAGNMKIIRKLENINGANKIMGNISSTLAQALNLPSTIRDNGVRNTAKAVLNAFNSEAKAAMNKSAFLTERYTNGGEKFSKTNWQKFSGSVSKATGMDLVEGAFIRLAWGANYQRLKSQGLKGFELIKQTDLATERAVGGRGVGAMPQAYQSALGKIFLQFTYETNETFKNDMAHVKGVVKGLKSGDYKKAGSMAVHGAEAMVTAMVLNAIYKQITGSEPLPDLIGAAIKTGANASKDDEDETKDNVVRNAVGNIGTEFIKSNPVASAAVNMWPKSGRQQIFGHDSDFGRFDGATGVAQTAFNAVGGALNLAAGESGKAAQNLAQLVPMGSQIRKTIGGGTALLRGAVTKKDKNGDEQVVYEVNNTDPVNIVKGLVFGKNALNETQAHYQAKDGQKTGGKVVSANSNLLKSVEKQYGKDSWQYIGLKEAMERRKSNKENAQYKTSVVGVTDEMRIKLAKGDLTQDKPEEGGLLRTRDGNVAKEFYKKLAKAEGKPDVFKEYINSDEGMKFEYLETQRQYDQAMKEGSLSKKEQIKKRQELTKMRVQSNWRKEYRDAYSLTNSYQDVQSIYALYGEAKNEVQQKLNEINDAMFKAKLIDQKTYDKRHENINEIDKPKRGRGGRRSTSDSFTVPKLPGYRITGAPDFQRTTKKGKGIVKGLKLAKAGGVDVSPLPRARITRR